MNFLKNAAFIFYCALFAIHITCSDYSSNPLDTSYQGNYKLTASFDSLPDTLYVFRTYNLNWAETGADEFYKIRLKTDPQNVIDTTFFGDENKPQPFPVRFTGVFDGELIVRGIRQNEKEVSLAHNVCVLSPYQIKIDTGFNCGVKLSVLNNVQVLCDSALIVKWVVNDTPADSLGFYDILELNDITSDSVSVKAKISDSTGNTLIIDSLLEVPKSMGIDNIR